MKDYILLMHNDAAPDKGDDADAWGTYIGGLRQAGAFEGGSTIGEGVCVRKSGAVPGISRQLGGYIRIQAASLEQACELLAGNPAYEAGGTIEIRELPQT